MTIQLSNKQMDTLFRIVSNIQNSSSEVKEIRNEIQKALKAQGFIQNNVLMLLSQITGIPVRAIKKGDKLGFHLGIGTSRKRFLAKPFQNIARQIKPRARVTIAEMAKMETVQDCIDLIKKKVS